MAELDPDLLHKLRVVDLKEKLSARGLPTSGLKADLVKRLKESILAERQFSEQPDEFGEDSGDIPGQFPEEQGYQMAEDWSGGQLQGPSEAQWFGGGESARNEQMRQAEQEQMRQTQQEQMRQTQQEQMWLEQQRRAAEEKQAQEEQERWAKEQEQRLFREEQERKIEEQRRWLEEQERIKAEEEQRRWIAEQEERKAVEQQRRWAEEQERLKAEQVWQEEQRIIETEKLRLAEEQRRLLMEEEERKMVQHQQRLLVEEAERKQLAEHQQMMLVEEQQRMLEEEERQKESELFHLQQQALIKKEEEQQSQPTLPMPPAAPLDFSVGFPPQTTAPGVQPMSHPPMSHMLTIPPQPPPGHVQMHPPPMGVMPPPSFMVPPVQSVAPIPPPPPPSAMVSTTGMSHPIPPMNMGRQMPHFVQPPPPPPTAINGSLIPPPMDSPIAPPGVTFMNGAPPASDSMNQVTQNLDDVEEEDDDEIMVPGTEDLHKDSIKLPQAVEQVFALKTKRAQQLGVDPDSVVMPPAEKPAPEPKARVTLVSIDEAEEDDEIEDEEVEKKSKEKKSRRRKKKKKKAKRVPLKEFPSSPKKDSEKDQNVDIDIEYVQDVLDPTDPLYGQFIKIFEKFKLNDPEKDTTNETPVDKAKETQQRGVANRPFNKKPADLDEEDDDDDMDDAQDDDKPKLSKRKLKKLSRMSVAELKQKVIRPELVEMHDVTAKDPILLLHLKASRNTVPVPRHWCFKRKYLQGKRGIEKPAFELPDFIKRTGIMEMRQALQEKEDQKTMKAKMRERVRPKMGKIDIDYQKLHDAFFKWQTKPKMTIHGDLYYEGKEFETRLKEKKPGDLSEDLRVALGMPTGPNANKCPPPWLIAMQRYGPPPSYPNLKIPGLNAPIPEGCSFGYHAGGWGKPPVDEMGRPLYGDVFGIQSAENMPHIPEEEIDHTLWGELESESSEEEEEEDDEDEDEDDQKAEDETGLVTPAEGLITPSGFSSIPAGMETPDMIELRKRKTEAEMEGGETPALYTILPEKKSDRVGAAMMGSTHIYDLSAAIPQSKVKPVGAASLPQGVEVALDPSELEMDTAAMAARYEQTMREQQSQLEKEDLSDMVAEHAARQKTKRKKQQQDSGKAPKKYKEFKF